MRFFCLIVLLVLDSLSGLGASKCGDHDFIEELEKDLQILSAVSGIVTVIDALPVADFISVIARMTATSSKLEQVNEVASCLENYARNSHYYNAQLKDTCSNIMSYTQDSSNTVQAILLAKVALSLIPFVGLKLVTGKEGAMIAGKFANMYGNLREWKNAKCEILMPEDCTCN